jgi:hypothetical protein
MVSLTSNNPHPVQIERSEAFILHSEIAQDDFEIKIWFPDAYSTSDRNFPVLYLLDGDFAFGMATDIVQYLIYGNHVPNMVIVGIGYGTKTGVNEGGKNNRGRDLLHTLPEWAREIWDHNPDLYRGSHFMQCLIQEIIPTVEARYRIDPADRTLTGYSGGGYFVTHVLFETEGVFKRIIQVDGCREDEALVLEEQYALTHEDLPVRLFVSSRFSIDGDCSYVERLKARNYPNLMLEFCYQDVAGHFAAPADGLTRGLVAVFHDWETSV